MQTIGQLIDKLQLAVFNADEWNRVYLELADAKEIGAQLRSLGGDEVKTVCKQMALTPREEGIYRALVDAGDRPVTGRELARMAGCKTLGSLRVHKHRLLLKLQRYGADIDTIRGEGYRLVGGAE